MDYSRMLVKIVQFILFYRIDRTVHVCWTYRARHSKVCKLKLGPTASIHLFPLIYCLFVPSCMLG